MQGASGPSTVLGSSDGKGGLHTGLGGGLGHL